MTRSRTWTHDEVVASGLLMAELTPAAIAEWPEEARLHVTECDHCGQEVDGDAILRAVAARIDLPRSQAPLIQALQLRAGQLVARSIEACTMGLAPFPADAYRGGALEVTRTVRGVRAWDPDARQLSFFRLGDQQHLTAILKEAKSERPGVALEFECDPDETTWIVVVATAAPRDPQDWAVWLDDQRYVGGTAPEAITGNALAHVRAVAVRPRLRTGRLRVQAAPLPPHGEACRALMLRATEHGKRGDSAGAVHLYREARDLAATLQDSTGEILATMGIAVGLSTLRFDRDARAVLTDLAGWATFDSAQAARLCRTQANLARVAGDLGEAREWLSEAARFEPEASWLLITRALVDTDRGASHEALHRMDLGIPPEFGSPDVWRVLQALNHACTGDPATAVAILVAVPEPKADDLEGRLDRLRAEVAIARVRGVVAWEVVLLRVAAIVDAAHQKGSPAWFVRTALQWFVAASAAASEPAIAARFVRLTHLPVDQALRDEPALLGLVATNDGVVIAEPTGGRARTTRLHRRDLQEACLRARQEVIAGEIGEACRQLAQLLVVRDALGSDRVLVASDGILAGAPMRAILSCIDRNAARPIAEACFATSDHPRSSAPLPRIASIADAFGDLPFASQEVEASDADVWLRGSDARGSALASIGPVGLIHIGVHADRVRGLPELQFADGAWTPPQIAALKFEGAPVVFLSSCGTADAQTDRGIEQSLGEAFLQAGARAVVATGWPVPDAEFHDFGRALVGAWPTNDMARLVASLCERLRAAGKSPRLWSAPVVYTRAGG